MAGLQRLYVSVLSSEIDGAAKKTTMRRLVSVEHTSLAEDTVDLP